MGAKRGIYFILTLFLMCAFPVIGQVIEPLCAGYIGGPGNNSSVGVCVSDNKVFVGGNFDQVVTPQYYGHASKFNNYRIKNLLSANSQSKGRLLIVESDSCCVTSVINLGNHIDDIAMAPNYPNNIAVSGDFGLAMFSPIDTSILWHAPALKNLTTIKVSDNGNIAAYSKTLSTLYYINGSSGQIIASTTLSPTEVNDVAIISDKIFITGFQQEENLGSRYCNKINDKEIRFLQIAYVYSFIEGTNKKLVPKDTTWGFKNTEMDCDIAPTRGVKLTAGKDGFLHFLGETTNDQNIFKYDGKTNWKLNNNSYPANHFVSNDKYSNLSDINPETIISYHARIYAFDGSVSIGQFIMARDPHPDSLKSKSYITNTGSLETDNYGAVYIGGMADSSIEKTGNNGVNYSESYFSGGDPALLVINSEYQKTYWQTFNSNSAFGSVSEIGISSDRLAFMSNSKQGELISHSSYFHSPFNSYNDTIENAHISIFYREDPFITSSSQHNNISKDKAVFDGKQIHLPENIKVLNAEIFDLQGRSYVLPNNSLQNLSIEYLPSGFYFVRITTQTEVILKKIFIP